MLYSTHLVVCLGQRVQAHNSENFPHLGAFSRGENSLFAVLPKKQENRVLSARWYMVVLHSDTAYRNRYLPLPALYKTSKILHISQLRPPASRDQCDEFRKGLESLRDLILQFLETLMPKESTTLQDRCALSSKVTAGVILH